MNVRWSWAAAVLLLCGAVLAVPAPAQKGKPGEVNTPPAKGERVKDSVLTGDAAPEFTLAEVQGDGKVTLSSFKGKRPVVLIFGSYT
jgi:hypothetical protein